jgi:class 3 adenylate cyclase
MGATRKIVTILFADVSGSTALGERLDAEALRRVMERYFEEMRIILERHGGTVEKFIGDAVMAVFGIPVAHEDDAFRAIRAAIEMRARLAELNEELARERGVTLAVRTGINTGEVVAGDPSGGQFYASGDAVNVASRLQQAAKPAEILLGEETYRLVRDAVSVDGSEPLTLKGKSDAVPAYRLLDVVQGAPALARRFDTPFVGRDEELAYLLACFERAVTNRMPVLVTVLGPPGIGKTRLAAELTAQIGERATVLRGRCLSYGEGITFWPLQEILRSLPALPPGVADPDEARSTEDTFLAYRKLFEALAAGQPLLLLLEDIHWAEPTTLRNGRRRRLSSSSASRGRSFLMSDPDGEVNSSTWIRLPMRMRKRSLRLLLLGSIHLFERARQMWRREIPSSSSSCWLLRARRRGERSLFPGRSMLSSLRALTSSRARSGRSSRRPPL